MVLRTLESAEIMRRGLAGGWGGVGLSFKRLLGKEA